MKKVLITGGAGFFGSHLSRECLRENEVFVLDNLSTGKKGNIEPLLGDSRFHFIEGDIRNTDLINPLIQKCDLIYHLAAAVGVRTVIQNPLETLGTNLEGTREIFTACARHGKKVIFASSSEIYGKTSKALLSESDDVILGPTSIGRWGYACSKALDEFLAFAFAKELGLKFVVIRYFNVIGPRQSAEFGMVVPRLIRQALQGEPLTVFGNGSQSRCFTHVNDAVRATLQLAVHPHAEKEVFNVGNPNPITILDLAKTILKISGSSSPIEFINPNQLYDSDFADMEVRTPDISKIIKLLNFKPQLSLHHAIEDMIAEKNSNTPAALPVASNS